MKKLIIWIFAILITLLAAYYQRKTGPTHPKDVDVTVGDSVYTVRLYRSGGERDARIIFPTTDTTVDARIFYKRFKVQEEWTEKPFVLKDIRYHSKFMTRVLKMKEGPAMAAYLPMQPPAGKLEYFISIEKNGHKTFIAHDQPVVIRFKGNVPSTVLIIHVILMFMTMLVSTVAGFYALARINRFRLMTIVTFVLLFLGGGVFGPWVQWYAFGDWWTGVPFGWDLTDNKTLFAFIFWVVALVGTRKNKRPWLVILAAVMTLVIFSIPHSLFGSELDYTTGLVTQG